ncbi:MAG: exodeoxyribonuclease VII large subunit [Gemmatimonadetes bacterium]|nr:exodeoxyribonuclease VII large subunit [Gemmatimonadota bacterium]
MGGGAVSSAEPRVWSVSQVNRAIRQLLEDTIPPIWISGEVGSWTRARSGHAYFALKDEEAQLRCVMWRSDAERLPVDPEVGMRVRAFGNLTLYEARGEYQFAVRALEGEGKEGLWRLAFERLRVQLEAEGLLAAERKRPLPRFPTAIGVVTSLTGAVLHDILSVIRRRAPWTRVVLRGTRVQGEGAAAEIADAIRVLGGSGEVELLIVGRGGGSVEDLWAFNEEPVARAIAECPVPIISAVGHEVDVTIADLVADMRAPTPSAAAEAAVEDREVVFGLLRSVRPRLVRALRNRMERSRVQVVAARPWLTRGVREILEPRRRGVESRGERLARGIRGVLDSRRERLGVAVGKIEALSPLSTLRRGYAVAMDGEGRVLRRTDHFTPGDSFDLRVTDGRVRCGTLEVAAEVDR